MYISTLLARTMLLYRPSSVDTVGVAPFMGGWKAVIAINSNRTTGTILPFEALPFAVEDRGEHYSGSSDVKSCYSGFFLWEDVERFADESTAAIGIS